MDHNSGDNSQSYGQDVILKKSGLDETDIELVPSGLSGKTKDTILDDLAALESGDKDDKKRHDRKLTRYAEAETK